MEKKILYFGYGANSQREMMEAITGNRSLKGRPGILKGYTLCVQKLSQAPDSVRKILLDSWGDNFETYIIKPDKNGEVTGTIWELFPQDRELVRDWELVDFGWYKDMKGKAETVDGQIFDVQTEGFREGQEVDREVDGKNYKPFLNSLEDFQRVAEKSRKEYLERIAVGKEKLSKV